MMVLLLGIRNSGACVVLFIAGKSLYFTSRLLLQRREVSEGLLALLAGLYANE